MPFKTLAQEADKYVGKTVILGGYILGTKLEVENLSGETIIDILQAPLSFQDEPKSKGQSEGKLIISHKGYLEPQAHSKNRKITVSGTFAGCMGEKIKICKIESREIYVWPEYIYNPPFYDPGSSYYWYKYYHRAIERSRDQIYQTLPDIDM